MISVLLVEDEPDKVATVKEAIGESVEAHCDVAGNANAALSLLEQRSYDLLILDLNIPLRDQGAPKADGGLRLLKELGVSGVKCNRPQHIIGLTGFEELRESFTASFAADTWQLLHYKKGEDEWREQLAGLLRHIDAAVSARPAPFGRVDLAIVTALRAPELDAVLDVSCGWEEVRLRDDATLYYMGTARRDGRQLKVVCACATDPGAVAAACLCMKVISGFRPLNLCMCGITAGIDVGMGDILVADQAWDYNTGKIITEDRQRKFRPAPSPLPMDAALKELLRAFVSNKADVIAGIAARWRAPGAPNTRLQALIGPIATGAAVIENKEVVTEILAANRKVIGVEMEVYGVYSAARTVSAPQPRVFAAKSACDRAIPPKKDDFQSYAAFTSAQFVFEFAMEHLSNPQE